MELTFDDRARYCSFTEKKYFLLWESFNFFSRPTELKEQDKKSPSTTRPPKKKKSVSDSNDTELDIDAI